MSRSRYDGRRRYSKRHDRYRAEWRARRDVVRHGIPEDSYDEYRAAWAMWTATEVIFLDYTEMGTGKYSDEHRGRRLATLPEIRARHLQREAVAKFDTWSAKRWFYKATEGGRLSLQ